MKSRRSGSIGWVLAAALLTTQGAWASQIRDASGLSNSPGFITFDPESPYYSKRTCMFDEDGIDRRTPSCILARSFLNREGQLSEEAVQSKIKEVLRLRDSVLAQYCNDNSDGSLVDPRECLKAASLLPTLQCDSKSKRASGSGMEEILCKWKSAKKSIAYDAAISEFERARLLARTNDAQGGPLNFFAAPNSKAADRFYEALFQGLEILDSLRSDNPVQGTFVRGVLDYGKDAFFRNIVVSDYEDNGERRLEATNLLVPQELRSGRHLNPEQAFFSPEELTRTGLDISRLDPPDSGFWRKPKWEIPSFQTRNYNGDLDPNVAPEFLDPESVINVFIGKPGNGSGKSPKLSVTLSDGKRKYKMKIKAELVQNVDNARGFVDPLVNLIKDGVEVHTEVVTMNLAAAIGFASEQYFYKRQVRGYLKDDGFTGAPSSEYDRSFAKAHRQMIQDQDDKARDLGVVWNYAKALGKIGVDAKGRKYVEVGDAAFETELDATREVNVGHYIKENLAKSFRREFRAFELFFAWIGDNDTKDQNADLNIVRTSDPEHPFTVVYSAADMGAALGNSLSKDRPNIFNPDLVKSSSEGRVELTYQTPFHGALFDRVTMADARWIWRLIGQLTDNQIREAFLGAGYHPVIAELFTQKMLRRRDQMIQALGLGNEFAPMSKMKDPTKYRVSGYEKLFNDRGQIVTCPEGAEPRHCEVFPPESGPTTSKVVTGYVAAGLDVLTRAIGQPITRTGLSKSFFVDGVRMSATSVSFLPARYLVPNPDPESEYPYWLLDVMRIGFGSGVDDVFDLRSSLDLAAIKIQGYKVHEFIRIHPVKNEQVANEIIRTYELYDPEKYPEKLAQALNGVREDSIKSLLPGDMLISTSYLAFGAGIYQDIIGTPGGVLFPVGLNASIGGQIARIKRVLVTKDNVTKEAKKGARKDANDLVAVWETFDSQMLQGDLNFKALFLSFPLFLHQIEARQQKDRAYRFDLNDQEQSRILIENLTRTLPEIPDSLDVKEVLKRDMETTRTSTFWSFFGIFNWLFSTERSEINQADGNTLVDQKDSRTKDGLYTMFKRTEYTEIESLGVVGDSPISRVKFQNTDHYATRQTLQEVYDKYLPLLLRSSSDMIRFAPGESNFYLGTLDLKGTLEFKKEALSDIFRADRTKQDVCMEFAAGLPFKVKFSEEQPQKEADERFPLYWCHYITSLNMVDYDQQIRQDFGYKQAYVVRQMIDDSREFLSDFDDARTAYQKMAKNPSEKSNFTRALDKINSLLKSSVSSGVLGALSQLTDEKNLIRKATLISSLNGFPGQERKVELKTSKDSQFKSIKAAFNDLFVDRYFRYLDNYHVFFSYFDQAPLHHGTVATPLQGTAGGN